MKSVSEDYTLYEKTQLDFITKKTVMFYDGASWIDISARIISIGSNSQRIEETLGNFEIGECKVTCDDLDGYFLGTGGKLAGISDFTKKISIKQGYAGVSDDIKTFEGCIDYESVRRINNDRIEFKILSYMSQLMLHAGGDYSQSSLEYTVKTEFDKALDSHDIEITHIPTYSGDAENIVEPTVSLSSGEIGRDILRKSINYGNATAEYFLITDYRLYKIEFDEMNGKVMKVTELENFGSDGLGYLKTASGDWGDEYLAKLFFNADQSQCFMSTLRHHAGLKGNDSGETFECDVVYRIIRWKVSESLAFSWILDERSDIGGSNHHVIWNIAQDSGNVFYFFSIYSDGAPTDCSLIKFDDGSFTKVGGGDNVDAEFQYSNAIIYGTDIYANIPTSNIPTPAGIPWRKYALADATKTDLGTDGAYTNPPQKNIKPIMDTRTNEIWTSAEREDGAHRTLKKYTISTGIWNVYYTDYNLTDVWHIESEDTSYLTYWDTKGRDGGLKRRIDNTVYGISNTNDSNSAKAPNILKAWIIQVDPDGSPTYDEYIWAYTEDNTLKMVRHGDEIIPAVTKDYTNNTALEALKDMANDFNCLMFIRPKDATYESYGWFGYRDNVLDWADAGEITLDDNEILNKEEFECWDYYAKRIEYTAGNTTFGYGDPFPTNARTLKFSNESINDIFADDMAKYLFPWYNKVRKVIKIKLKKPHFHYEIFDYIKIDNKKYIMTELRRDKVLTATFLQAET